MMVVAGAMVVGGRWGRGWRWRVVGGRSEKFEDGWEGGGRGGEEELVGVGLGGMVW